MGGSDAASEGTWKWTDGSVVPRGNNVMKNKLYLYTDMQIKYPGNVTNSYIRLYEITYMLIYLFCFVF